MPTTRVGPPIWQTGCFSTPSNVTTLEVENFQLLWKIALLLEYSVSLVSFHILLDLILSFLNAMDDPIFRRKQVPILTLLMLPQVDLRDRQALEDIFSSHRSLFLPFFLSCHLACTSTQAAEQAFFS
jgi:hypothetical protein